MDKPPIYRAQRFFPFEIRSLIDKDSYTVQKFVENRTYADIAKDILIMVRYPFYKGKPDDMHKYYAFRGLLHYNRVVPLDYWQKGEETIGILTGDCEDSSILAVSSMRAKGKTEKEVYEILGYVTKEDGTFLGGHGYSVFKENNEWHLYESTMNYPPGNGVYPGCYPVIEDIRKPYHVNGIVYHHEQIFNDKEYEQVKVMTKIGNIEAEKKTNFFMSRKCRGRRVRKHLMIAKAFRGHCRLEKEIRHSIVGRIRYHRILKDIKRG